jgi:hypothetical protein
MPKAAIVTAIAVVVALACLSTSGHTVEGQPAEEGGASGELGLHALSPPDGMTILRTILEVRRMEILDPRTLRLDVDAETLLLAEAVLRMVDPADGPPADVALHEAPDGSVIAVVPLRQAPMQEVWSALRQGLDIRKVAGHREGAIFVLRDDAEKIAAALELIEQLEASASADG